MELSQQEIKVLKLETHKFSPIWDSNQNGVITVDKRWTITYYNKSVKVISSFPGTSMMGKNFWTVFKHLFSLDVTEPSPTVLIKNDPYTFLRSKLKKDSPYIITSIYYNKKLCICFKNKIPETVREPDNSRVLLMNYLDRMTSELTNICLWDWDLKTKETLWINGGHKHLFGYDIEDTLLPQDFWESLIHPDDKSAVFDKLNEVLVKHSETKWRIEYRFKKVNGDYIYVLDTGLILHDADNVAYRIIGATQDITDRKNSEQKLIDSENKLSLIVEQTSNVIIITDSQGLIIYVNKAFTGITGYMPTEVQGRTSKFLEGKETDETSIQFIQKKVTARLPFTCRIAYYSKSRIRIWMNVQGQPLEDNSNIPLKYFFIKSDITDKVELEEQLHAERLSKQNEITSSVLEALEKERNRIGSEIHDNLNHTLVAANLYLGLAGNDSAHKTDFIHKSSTLISQVIEQIRKISQTLVTSELLGLIAHIKTLIADLKLIMPMRISFSHQGIKEKSLNENLKLSIFRIIQEQLTNVIKHSKAHKVQIDLRLLDRRITLVISDDGIGCDVSRKVDGVGLRNILTRVELFGGVLSILSSPGNGFVLTINILKD